MTNEMFLPLVLKLAIFMTIKFFFVETVFKSEDEIFRPGPGLLRMQFEHDKFDKPGRKASEFPYCPSTIENMDNFSWTHGSNTNKPINMQYKAYFVPAHTGNHRFFAACSQNCSVFVVTNNYPYAMHYEYTYYAHYPTITHQGDGRPGWENRTTSRHLNLREGFRYLLKVNHFGTGLSTDFFQLGVILPDEREIKPISNMYLRRSMEFYRYEGFVVKRYDAVQDSGLNMTTFLTENSGKFSAQADETFPCIAKFPDRNELAEFFALKYTGVFLVPSSGSYEFKMSCDDLCRLRLEGDQIETAYNKPPQILGPKYFFHNQQKNVEIIFIEYLIIAYLNITLKISGANENFPAYIRNLPLGRTSSDVKSPFTQAINSTAISVYLAMPAIPVEDLWEYDSKCELTYYKSSSYNSRNTLTLTGSLPSQTVISGLDKYKHYFFEAFYFGKLNKTFEYNIFSRQTSQRTDEDLPDIYPQGLSASALNSVTIRCTWNQITDTKLINGVFKGYHLEYRKKTSTKNWNWVSPKVNDGQIDIGSLDKFTLYEFRLAANSSKGRGPLSPLVTEKTMEDVPSGIPLNTSARNESSKSINVHWEEIIEEDRNGIIINYIVYIRKSNSSDQWVRKVVTAPDRSLVIADLNKWTFYDIKVAGATRVGEGINATITKVRTDESTPDAGPANINLTALSSKSIKLSWHEIPMNQRNGIIIFYEITYQRSDKRDVEHKLITNNQTLLCTGLDEFVFYDFSVAGITIKGVGVPSEIHSQRTLQDIPSGSPSLFKGNNISSTAIGITWSTIPEDDRNGIILSYTIKHRLNNSMDEWKNTTVNSSTFSLELRSLEIYRLYEIQIWGSTVVGSGTNVSTLTVSTDVNAPTKAPMNLTGHFIDHRAINISWNCVPEGFRYATITEYILRFRDLTIFNAEWTNITIADTMNNTCTQHNNISNLKIYTPYEFRISAVNFKGDGVISKDITVWTDEFIPAQSPKNLTGVALHSTSIVLNWTSVAEIHGAANGKVLGYRIHYRVIDCYSDRLEGCDESEILKAETPDASSNLNLTKLRKFTNYSISVQVFNSKGAGNSSYPIYVKTEEDEPDAAPTTLETWPGKYHSIKVFWSPIPESLRNGIILGYRIFYKQLDVPMRRYDRAPRSVNSLAILGALSGEKVKEVAGSVNEVEVNGLVHFSWYQIRIAGLTSKGLGKSVSINGTCKQGSPLVAPELQVRDPYDIHEISMKWNEISLSLSRGEVLGYRIKYWPIEVESEALIQTIENIAVVYVYAPNRTVVLKDLPTFTKYAITISAFTEGGFGVTSDIFYGETCRCPEKIKASWMAFPPLVNKNKPISGIFPKFLRDGIKSCCAECSGRPSHVDWEEKRLNSSDYDKQSLQQLVISGTHVTLPFFKDSSQIEGNKESPYIYIPVVKSPGIAIFRRKSTVAEIGDMAAGDLADSIFRLVPYFAVTFLMSAVAGIVFWFLERKRNEEQFSGSFIRGSGNGFWLAYITMTTAGYGDVAPKSILGRIFAIGWTICGIVLVSLVVGALAVFQNSSKMEPSKSVKKPTDRTLASNDTFMISIMDLRRRTVIGDTSDVQYVRESLLSGKIRSVVYEAFEALHHKEALKHPMIELEAFKVVDASYGILLGGKAKPIKSCLNGYFSERSQEILVEVSNYSTNFKVEKSTEEKLATVMLSSDANITKSCVRVGLIVLCVCIVLGAIYDFYRWCRGRAKTASAPSQLETIYHELNTSIESLVDTLHEKTNMLEAQHTCEMIRLLNMDEKDIRNIDPDLHIFDQTLQAKVQKIQYPSRKDPKPSRNYAVYDEGDSVNSDGDQPITYRYSEVH